MKCITENAPDNVLRVLVGNKSDLHHRLVISSQEGKRLADKYQVDFFETSAKSSSTNEVSDMFDTIIKKLLDLDQSQSKESTKTIDLLDNNPSDTLYEKYIGCCSFTGTPFEKR